MEKLASLHVIEENGTILKQIEQEGKAAASNDITKGLHFLSQVARATFLVSVFTPICLKIAQLTKRMKAVARAATR